VKLSISPSRREKDYWRGLRGLGTGELIMGEISKKTRRGQQKLRGRWGLKKIEISKQQRQSTRPVKKSPQIKAQKSKGKEKGQPQPSRIVGRKKLSDKTNHQHGRAKGWQRQGL